MLIGVHGLVAPDYGVPVGLWEVVDAEEQGQEQQSQAGDHTAKPKYIDKVNATDWGPLGKSQRP